MFTSKSSRDASNAPISVYLESYEDLRRKGVPNGKAQPLELNQMLTGDSDIDPRADCRVTGVKLKPTQQTLYRVERQAEADATTNGGDPIPSFVSVHGTRSGVNNDGTVKYSSGPVDLYFDRPHLVPSNFNDQRQTSYVLESLPSRDVSVSPSNKLSIGRLQSQPDGQTKVLASLEYKVEAAAECYGGGSRWGSSSSAVFSKTQGRKVYQDQRNGSA